MLWSKSRSLHWLRTPYENTFFTESRLVFVDQNQDRQVAQEAATAIERKKAEIRTLEQQFQAAQGNIQERYRIKGVIDEAKQELMRLERGDFTSTNLLQDGLNNSVASLKRDLEVIRLRLKKTIPHTRRAKLMSQQAELEVRIQSCESALTNRLKPVNGVSDIDEAEAQILLDNHFLSKIRLGTFNQIDIEQLLQSDYLPFFDPAFQKRLKEEGQGLSRIERLETGRGQVLNLIEGAEAEWLDHVKARREELMELHSRKVEINSNFESSSKDAKERFEKELREIESQIRHITRHIENDGTEWKKRRIREKENEQNGRSIDFISPEILTHLKQVITEARDLKLGKIHEYLESEAKNLDAELSRIKTAELLDGAMSPKSIKEWEDEIEDTKMQLLDRSVESIEEIKKRIEHIKQTKRRLADFQNEMMRIKLMRPQLKTQATLRLKRFKEALKNIPKDQLEAAKAQLLAEAAAKGKTPENSPILKKDLDGADFLAGKGEPIEAGGKTYSFDQAMAEMDQKLTNFDELSNEEIKALTNELATYTRLITNRVDADKSHKTITELERAIDLNGIRKTLENELGKEHVQLLPHDQFEAENRKYTKMGYMVFYQKGDEWKIIIDENAFDESKYTPEQITAHVDKIKAQLRHELLHLEFEKNEATQEAVRKKLVLDHPEEWQKARKLFIEHARSTKKLAPDVKEGDETYFNSPQFEKDWKDDYILSEIFAMELGNQWSEGTTPLDQLNNLIYQISAASEAKMDALSKTYNPENDPAKRHGFEETIQSNDKEAQSIEAPSTIVDPLVIKNKEAIEKINNTLNDLAQSDYLKRIQDGPSTVENMRVFNNKTAELNERLNKELSNEALKTAISGRISELNKDIGEIDGAIKKIAKSDPNTGMSFLRNIWNNTRFLSLADFVKMGTDVKEFFARRLNRRNEDNAAALGMALFGGTAMGSESRARMQKSEAGEVSEWKGRYETLDGWQVLEELESVSLSVSPNKDQLKAILRTLADKGRLEWHNPHLWRVLNKLQDSTEFKLINGECDETLLKNPILLREKMQIAMGSIYDNEEFPTLERTNQSNYDSNKSKYNPIHDRMPTQLTARLDELLSEHMAGKKVDPMLYESILESCMTMGRSYGENVMFHLLAGMAHGLLPADRGLALTKNNNTWPPVEWFNTLGPYTKNDFVKLCEDNFKEAYEAGTLKKGGDAFKNWFWTTIQMNGAVIGRAKKSVSERNWDHDWGRTIVCLGDADTAQRFFQGRGGQKETKVTAVGNTIAGMIQMLEENAINRKNVTREQFSRIAGIMAMTEGILGGTAYNGDNDTYTRETDEINREPPREGEHGRHPKLSTKDHRKIYMQFLTMLDKKLFGELLKGELVNKNDKQERGQKVMAYLKKEYPALVKEMGDMGDAVNIDQIYNKIGLITNYIITNLSESRFKQILDVIEARARIADAQNAGQSVDPALQQMASTAA